MALRPTALVPVIALQILVGLAVQPGRAAARTLADLYPLALQHDPTIKAARASQAAANEKLPQARSQLRPQVSLSADQLRNQLELQGRSADYTSANRTVQLRQGLLRPAQWAAVEQAEHVVAEAAANLESAERELLTRLSTAVFEHLFAREQLRFATALEATTRAQLAAAQRVFEQGSGVRTDVDEARARQDAAAVQAMQARFQVETTQRQLERLTGVSPPALSPLVAQDLWDRLEPVQPVAQLVQTAELEQPVIRALQARLAIARADVRRVSLNYAPTVDLLSRLSHSRSENVFNPDSRYRNRQLGIQLNWPLYEGGLTQSAEREALARVSEAEQRLEAGRHDLHQKIEEQSRALTEGRQRVDAQRQALASAAQLAISSQRSFEAGNRTRLDVINAEQQKLQAERDLMQARLSYLAAHVRLKLLAGAAPATWLEQLRPWFESSSGN